MEPDIITIPGTGITIIHAMLPGDLEYTITHGPAGDSQLGLASEGIMDAMACGVRGDIIVDTDMAITADTVEGTDMAITEDILRGPNEDMPQERTPQTAMFIITGPME